MTAPVLDKNKSWRFAAAEMVLPDAQPKASAVQSFPPMKEASFSSDNNASLILSSVNHTYP